MISCKNVIGKWGCDHPSRGKSEAQIIRLFLDKIMEEYLF